MSELVPLRLYFDLYINLSLFIVFFTLLHAYAVPINNQKNIAYIQWMGYFFLVFLILFIGFRPVSGRYFGDMATYNMHYLNYARGGEVDLSKDAFFDYFMKFCSYVMSAQYFFVLCATLYIFPLYRVSKVFFKKYWFYAFLMFTVSFSFWSYGVNGLRNGIATSMFLLAVSYYDKKVWMIVFFILATQIHKTLLLPVLAFVLTHFYSNSKTYLIFWLMAIPLSLALGGVWESLFTSLGFGDDRLDAYLSGASGGFRYDFLIYSSGAVFSGWYFIFKKNFKDKIYGHIYNTYLISNGFWILVIRASFSNRFAYLSWFMMALVIIYPLLKKDFFVKQHIVIGKILTGYFMFTYLMVYIYYQFFYTQHYD